MSHACKTQNELIELAKTTFDIEIEGLQAVKERLGSDFALAVTILAGCTGRVVISGIGKSGLVGRKLAATFSSTGSAAFFMHPVEAQHGDLGSIRKEDVVIAISNSGKTDELNAILPALRAIGASIIALTGGVNSPLAKLADVTINTAVPREACPFNLAPTSSTTAVLAVGDALAVCLIDCKSFTENDFKRVHPGGALGARLRQKITDIMHTQNIPQASASTSVTNAIESLNKGNLGALLLLDTNGKVTGLLTDGDLRRVLSAGRFEPDASVSKIMTTTFKFATVNMSVAEVLDIMEGTAITVLPVLDDKRTPIGIIHLHDLLGKGQIKFGA